MHALVGGLLWLCLALPATLATISAGSRAFGASPNREIGRRLPDWERHPALRTISGTGICSVSGPGGGEEKQASRGVADCRACKVY